MSDTRVDNAKETEKAEAQSTTTVSAEAEKAVKADEMATTTTEASASEPSPAEAAAPAESAAPATPAEPAGPLSPSDELRKQIEAERLKRAELVERAKRLRSRLAYKKSEGYAITKLLQMAPAHDSIGRLKRMKEALEFKIATEAKSLDDEKNLLKHMNEIDEKLEEALKGYRLEKKAETIAREVESMDKEVAEVSGSIEQVDKNLDEMHMKLNSMSDRGGMRQHRPHPKDREVKQLEISMQDIAIIKKKGEAKEGNNKQGA